MECFGSLGNLLIGIHNVFSLFSLSHFHEAELIYAKLLCIIFVFFIIFSLNPLSGPIQSRCPSIVCVSVGVFVCAIAEILLPGGLDTSGRRT